MTDRYSFIAGSLCQTGDRYLRSGYKEAALTIPQVLRSMNERGVAQGVELHHRGTETPADVDALRDALGPLRVTYVNAWTYGERQWRFGSLSAADRSTRREAVARCKAAIGYARELGALGVSLWLGQDGFDYAFQTDYRSQWEALLESLRELCDDAQGMPVALEPKAREPRNRSLIDTVQTALLLRMESRRENLGITVDTGHVLCGGQGAGPSLMLAMRHEALYNVHVNDNYGAWDDDMIVGSVHLNEALEIFYLLKKYRYQGYLSVDIFPYREDPFDAVEESIRCMMDYDRVVERLGVERIDGLIAAGDVPATLRALRQAVFGPA
ncbi:MAG: sugar phosphate isomerase/epimerase family protein [Candidatus Limiplasma sp.]|nr:sugar phosphate isomerase/epimerase family protein [Candidatus Limiplasma sp.]